MNRSDRKDRKAKPFFKKTTLASGSASRTPSPIGRHSADKPRHQQIRENQTENQQYLEHRMTCRVSP
jgi:hypothetical protein